MAAEADLNFIQQLALTMVGSLLSAGAGGLLVGWLLARSAQRYQSNREAFIIRSKLIDDMTRVGTEISTRLRTQERISTAAGKDDFLGADGKKELQNQLHVLFSRGSVEAARLEARLRVHVGEDARQSWHGVWDCVTVRYYKSQVLPEADISLIYRLNAGKGHTGLRVTQMEGPILDGGHPVVVAYDKLLVRATTLANNSGRRSRRRRRLRVLPS